MARALLVGCGCRGRALGAKLAADGWAVRGTSRTDAGLEAISAAGIEAVRADPDRLGTITDLIGDITVLAWLMGGATANPAANGARLESLLERLVDTPVRGLLYEARGEVAGQILAAGAAMVEDAHERWRIPVALLRADPRDPEAWVEEASEAVASVLA